MGHLPSIVPLNYNQYLSIAKAEILSCALAHGDSTTTCSDCVSADLCAEITKLFK